MRLAFFVTVFTSLLLTNCSKDTISPENFGDINGVVLNQEDQTPISGAGITTAPPTDAILTDENGTFSITDIPEGNYTIQARKEGFSNSSVSISVRTDRPSNATLLMEVDEDEADNLRDILTVQITREETYASGDSNFVDVDYEVENISSTITLTEYELYFQIFTPSSTLNQQEDRTTIRPGQKYFGTFTRYTREEVADSVRLNDIWAPGFEY